jgi:hypothetical protein
LPPAQLDSAVVARLAVIAIGESFLYFGVAGVDEAMTRIHSSLKE